MPARLPFTKGTFNHDKHAGSLLAASTRTKDHALRRPTDDIHSFLHKDLAVEKLNKIHTYLWLAGRPVPPKPLNYQIAISRKIVTDERIDMHLIWEPSGLLHLKPIPRYLLDADFWHSHLICTAPCCEAEASTAKTFSTTPCSHELYKYGLGFLHSYVALIQFESDLAMAHSYHLLPAEVTWLQWLSFVEQLLQYGARPGDMNERYLFGELRLSQLNKICSFRYGRALRGYQYIHRTYGDVFRAYLTPITMATVYVALVLTAMQVGLATKGLGSDSAFQNSSYGFTVFAILAPLIGVGLAGLFGMFQFCMDLFESWWFQRDRLLRFDSTRIP
ncbi:hypothetical protein N7466_003483 [Penicillium verhagenii]|uniref:uncharacterized protein n=1 Tax=Penicillium verhagenii TaxID=1562060 RepID=UPI002545210B|nr:uncharacterized protein N7466_003483 [Penicillium verhagenii]KAJ5937033.1 hypothetical protein N7466_003483 [Penicillium verhagenii]